MSTPKYLVEFFQRFIERYGDIFDPDIDPEITDDGRLLFRGPVKFQPGNDLGRGTHAIVELDQELMQRVDALQPMARNEALTLLLAHLGSQLRARYSREKLGKSAYKVVGTVSALDAN